MSYKGPMMGNIYLDSRYKPTAEQSPQERKHNHLLACQEVERLLTKYKDRPEFGFKVAAMFMEEIGKLVPREQSLAGAMGGFEDE